uniref:Uncharacterized protein n=1 Tax=Gasterosteus aculeatus TaxID=69293 RepID=G3PF82_GASAC
MYTQTHPDDPPHVSSPCLQTNRTPSGRHQDTQYVDVHTDTLTFGSKQRHTLIFRCTQRHTLTFGSKQRHTLIFRCTQRHTLTSGSKQRHTLIFRCTQRHINI